MLNVTLTTQNNEESKLIFLKEGESATANKMTFTLLSVHETPYNRQTQHHRTQRQNRSP